MGETNQVIDPLFYPDWDGVNESCLNDGNQPMYMNNNQNAFMYNNLKSCCIAHYSWALDVCMGTEGSDPGSGKWFVDYENFKCAQDCTGDSPCGDVAQWDIIFDTVDSCCQNKLWWINKEDCIARSTGTAQVQRTATGKYYVDWTSFACVKDCVEAEDCGGFANEWDVLFDKKELCCTSKLGWKNDCM